MREELKTLHQQIQLLANDLLNRGVGDRDRHQSFSHELWEACGQLKLQGLLVPTELGGLSLNPSEMMNALCRLGDSCTDNGLTFSIGAHLLACVVPLHLFGSTEQKEKYLQKLSNGTWIGANAMTEEHAGSNVFAMNTIATRTDEGYHLKGSKSYVTNGPVADVLLTYARLEDTGEITAFIIEKGMGYNVSQPIEKMGLRTCTMGNIVFEDMFVPPSNVLGKEGMGENIFMQTMDWERIGLSALQTGIMQRIYADMVQHVTTRKIGNDPLASFQTLAHRLAEMKIQLSAASSLVEQAATGLGKTRTVGRDAAITKVFVSRAYQQMAKEGVQLLGAKGFLTEHEKERELRDAMAATIYSGTTEVMMNSIAKWEGIS